MFLKIEIPTHELATAIVETAIECAGNPTEIKQRRISGTDSYIYSVYLKGSVPKLKECRMSIVKAKYYRQELFSFRTAQSMSLLADAEEE